MLKLNSNLYVSIGPPILDMVLSGWEVVNLFVIVFYYKPL